MNINNLTYAILFFSQLPRTLWLVAIVLLVQGSNVFAAQYSYQLDSFSNLYHNDALSKSQGSNIADTALSQRIQLRLMAYEEIDEDSYFEAHYEMSSESVIYKNSGEVPDINGPITLASDGLYRIADLTSSHSIDKQNALNQNLDRLIFHKEFERFDMGIGRQAITFGTAKFSSQSDVLFPLSVGSLMTDYRQGVDAIRLEYPVGILGVLDAGWVAGESNEKSAGFFRLKHHNPIAELDFSTIQLHDDALISLGANEAWGDVGLWQELTYVQDGLANTERTRFSFGADNRFGDFLLSGEYHFNGLGTSNPSHYISNAFNFSLYQKGSIPLLAKRYFFLSADYLEGTRHQFSLQHSFNLNDKSQLLSLIYGFNINEQWDAILQGNVPLDFLVRQHEQTIAEFSQYNHLVSLNLKAVF